MTGKRVTHSLRSLSSSLFRDLYNYSLYSGVTRSSRLCTLQGRHSEEIDDPHSWWQPPHSTVWSNVWSNVCACITVLLLFRNGKASSERAKVWWRVEGLYIDSICVPVRRGNRRRTTTTTLSYRRRLWSAPPRLFLIGSPLWLFL